MSAAAAEAAGDVGRRGLDGRTTGTANAGVVRAFQGDSDGPEVDNYRRILSRKDMLNNLVKSPPSVGRIRPRILMTRTVSHIKRSYCHTADVNFADIVHQFDFTCTFVQ